MKDPKTVEELNQLIKGMDIAMLGTSTKIRFFTALRARLMKSERYTLATICKAKAEEYKRLGEKNKGLRL